MSEFDESYYMRGNQLLLEGSKRDSEDDSDHDDSPGLGICNCFGVILFERKAAANEELNAKEEELPKGNPLLDNTPQLCLVSKEGSHLLKSCGMMMWYRESGTWGNEIKHLSASSEVLEIKGKRGKTIVHELDRPRLSWRQKLEICLGAARGLHYIHTDSARGIIHRDMKSDNILFDENFMDKVSEFGLFKTSRS
ncbi:hypothetical protein IGI04_037427 [Brassica rapa subsp. trilocularis]|uniref:Protein kinase domain-containing protein n=1 Tax=Brassica rapa subsp. trilocularis TaxID=1813537 RepID=A0ABQ7LHC7_BRACM|nr:hypothetical protein IGI04_037427 [Brassica rapa subsp. trilocularis]